MRRIFVSGGTGYIGRAVIPRLTGRENIATGLVRQGSERKLPPGAAAVVGNALDAETFSCDGYDTFIHLVGTAHPAPWKGAQFRSVDLVALRASVKAAVRAGIGHFVFLSVAQPAPVMRAYLAVRAECEQIIRDAGLTATIVWPWYVLGPGHWWPALLTPLYWLAERIQGTRESARRLGLVRLNEMVDTLVWVVEHAPAQTRVLGVPEIRACAGKSSVS